MNRFRRPVSLAASSLALLALLAVPVAAAAAPAAQSPQEPALSGAGLAEAVELEIGTDCLDTAFAASTWTCEDHCDQTLAGCHEVWCSESYDPYMCNQCFSEYQSCMNAC